MPDSFITSDAPSKALDDIQEQLEIVRLNIEKFFKGICATSTNIVPRDKFWGKRVINLYIRLDEFSPAILEQHLDVLKKLMQQFQTLRQTEREIASEVEIANRLRRDILLGIKASSIE